MNICKSCGIELEEGLGFCGNCGLSVENADDADKYKKPLNENTINLEAISAYNETVMVKAGLKKRSAFIALIIVLAVIIFLIALYFVQFSGITDIRNSGIDAKNDIGYARTTIGEFTSIAKEIKATQETLLYNPPQKTVTYLSESTFVPPESTFVPPKSTWVAPESNFVPPKSTWVAPEPAFVPPERNNSETISRVEDDIDAINKLKDNIRDNLKKLNSSISAANNDEHYQEGLKQLFSGGEISQAQYDCLSHAKNMNEDNIETLIF
jgi:type II secretory pathway pseudopilin PulG